jgi:ADP-ribosylglycohydrolase
MPIPKDYVERVYAGVLGKIIGVYLGRPFEGWTYEQIMARLGEVNYYVHEQLGKPLIVTDDDIAGTFTFLRALPDYGNRRELTPAQIGQSWLNYLIEGRTVLWWGGLGMSTEHTAYLRLKAGYPAPVSGSMALNSKVVAEQIGAQIFIDGWAMVAPGDPALAADLARRAAGVSHDGEAVYGAQMLAAMEAQAFVETDVQKLLDAGLRYIPKDSIIARMIGDIREWHAVESDWRTTREYIALHYGYDKYGGNCHMVPNHALIILALLYGGDSFQRALMIANTCGWDTDCNSGNVGCLMGIKEGLAGIEAGPDWRGPVADQLYLPTADGGRAISDAVSETYHIVNSGRALAGLTPLAPKDGARFHFELPGSVQGFRTDESVDSRSSVQVENTAGHSVGGKRSLALHYHHIAAPQVGRVATPTFIPPAAKDMPGYGLLASPTLYSGQTVRAALEAGAGNERPIECRLYIQSYSAGDALRRIYGSSVVLGPGERGELTWRIEDTGCEPIAEIGVELRSNVRADGVVYLDYLAWDGEPDVELGKPAHEGVMWRQAWVDGVDQVNFGGPEPYRLIQNYGTGLLMQGTRDWRDYRASAAVSIHMAKAAGIAVRVQGMRRYYALLLCADGKVRLVRALDGRQTLAETSLVAEQGAVHHLSLQAQGPRLTAMIDGDVIFDVEDRGPALASGAVGLVCEEGRAASGNVRVEPAVTNSEIS